MKIKQWKLILVAVLLVLGWGLATENSAKAASDQPTTVFVHGLQGSHKSTDTMIADLSNRYPGTKKVMTINVQPNGSLKTRGHVTSVKHPLVQVNFINNSASTTTNAKWLGSALKYLKTKQGVNSVDLVAHSAGNVAVYQLLSSRPSSIPTVKKFVILAGPFDGVLSLNDTANKNKVNRQNHDEPSIKYPANSYYPSYQQLEKMGKSFPKNVQVMNVYGNVGDGTNSDTLVSNASALSVNYLLRHQNTPVVNHCWRSAQATHSGLHRSQKVDNWIANFLWK